MTTLELAGTIGASLGGAAAAVWFAVKTLGGLLVAQIERHDKELREIGTWIAVATEKLDRDKKDLDKAHQKIRDLERRFDPLT
jgi:hypothetical protein